MYGSYQVVIVSGSLEGEVCGNLSPISLWHTPWVSLLYKRAVGNYWSRNKQKLLETTLVLHLVAFTIYVPAFHLASYVRTSTRPVTSLGHQERWKGFQEGTKFSELYPIFLCCVLRENLPLPALSRLGNHTCGCFRLQLRLPAGSVKLVCFVTSVFWMPCGSTERKGSAEIGMLITDAQDLRILTVKALEGHNKYSPSKGNLCDINHTQHCRQQPRVFKDFLAPP